MVHLSKNELLCSESLHRGMMGQRRQDKTKKNKPKATDKESSPGTRGVCLGAKTLKLNIVFGHRHREQGGGQAEF